MIVAEVERVKTIYANAQQPVTLLCAQCGKTTVTQVSAEIPPGKLLHVRCGCGHGFCIYIEVRKHYRTPTHLPGQYVKIGEHISQGLERGRMLVEDLSQTGLRLRTTGTHTCQVEDVIRVNFHLDDPQRLAVNKLAVVKWSNAEVVGAAFLDFEAYNDINRDLTLYLMAG
jgi:hypothetical protein